MVDRPSVSIKQAQAIVGVSRRTIYIWMAANKVEYVRTAGGSVRIFVDSLWRGPVKEKRQPVEPTIIDPFRNQGVA